jgi:hypothetical protein
MLTAAQRFHFDVNGYVLLKNVLAQEECRRLVAIAERMKADSKFPRQDLDRQTILYGSAWYDRFVLDLAMDPRLREPAEEIVGSEARLEESEFIIFHPLRARLAASATPGADRWHRGLKPGPGSYEAGGHYHCLFTKTVTYLSDNRPETGTWVIPGSHRMSHEVREVMDVVDQSLMRQVVAQQGDVLLFGETLIHSSPEPMFERDRLLLVIAYCAPYMSPWGVESDPPDAFAADLSDEQRRFVYGEARYQARPRKP